MKIILLALLLGGCVVHKPVFKQDYFERCWAYTPNNVVQVEMIHCHKPL